MELWRQLSYAGIKDGMSHFEVRTITLTNRLSVVISVILLAYLIPAAYESLLLIPLLVLSILLYLGTLILNRAGRNSFACYYFIIISFALNMVISILPGPGSGERYYFIATGLLPLLLLKSPRQIFGLTLLNALLFLLVFYLQMNLDPVIHAPEELKNVFLPVNIVVILALVYLSLLYFRRENDAYEQKLVQVNQIITMKNKEITDSIRYASRLQHAILPTEKNIKQALPDSFVLLKPKDIVSGDFYWLETEDNRIYFAAVDCTGHGVPGAMVSFVGHIGLNRVLKEFKLDKPGVMLDKLSELVEETFGHGDEEIKDGMDMALCCLDREKLTVEFAGANNPLYYTNNAELQELKGDRQPIGRHASSKPFTNHLVELKKGDCLYLSSDGFADQFGGEAGKKFKYGQFKKLLGEGYLLEMSELKVLLDETIEGWKGELEQVDDICVLGVRI